MSIWSLKQIISTTNIYSCRVFANACKTGSVQRLGDSAFFQNCSHKIILHPSIEIPQTSPWEQVMGREGTDRESVKILFQITNVAMVKQHRSPPQVMKFEILRTQSVTTTYTISLSRNLEQKSLGCLTGSNTQWNSQ